MEMKDVLKYYVGCEAHCEFTGTTGILTSVSVKNSPVLCHIEGYGGSIDAAMVKPILKRLSDITEEDAIQWYNLHFAGEEKAQEVPLWDGTKINTIKLWLRSDKHYFNTATFHYLLSRGYDLFNLIDSGQAIDAKTVK